MFINDLKNQDNGRKTIIGEFVRIEDNCVVLKTVEGEIKVVNEDIDAFQSKNVMVIGTIENNKFIGVNVRSVEDDFNFKNYNRLVKLCAKYPEIF